MTMTGDLHVNQTIKMLYQFDHLLPIIQIVSSTNRNENTIISIFTHCCLFLYKRHCKLH